MDNPSEHAICAVIVCFEPELTVLENVVAKISGQVQATLVIDNGSDPNVRKWLADQHLEGALWYLRQTENLGVAAAYNLGIDWAKAHGHTHILLLDQDSFATPNMVSRLFETLLALEKQGKRVAAVGPALFNSSTHTKFPFIKLGLLTSRCYPTEKTQGAPIEADIIISSGKLIPLDVIDVVGAMNEALFIDNVDVEWCFRASACAYRLYGVGTALMHHTLGDRICRVWFFRGRLIIVHKPVRLYYMMRNRVHLYGMSSSPWLWILQDWYRLVLKLAIFSILIRPRRENCLMMLRGLRDGLAGVIGRYDPKIKRDTLARFRANDSRERRRSGVRGAEQQ